MIESKTCEYDTAIRCAVRIFPGLASVPNAIRQTAEEIRIRSGYPIIIRTGMQNHITQITPDSEMLAECISAICQNSLHTYEKDIANGFITLYGGHRAGLCGTAVYSNGGLQTVKNFSSINIRIARQHYGAARDLLPLFESECRSRGLLIVGRALSGKTTILRDLCRCIGGMYNGKPCLDVGLMTDVFSGYGKSDGIIRAVRCMSPDYIVTDELGADAKSIRQAVNSGSGLIMTAHADSIEEAYRNEGIRTVIDSGAIQHIALVQSHRITAVKQLITAEANAVCTI